MATPGRKNIPSNIHILRGNPSKKPAHELADSVLPAIAIPKCPSHLLPAAKAEWKRITPELESLGLISELDMAALSAYCQSYARWVNAESKLKKLGEDGLITETPSGYQQMSVLLQISNRALDQMHKFMTEFGMSPSSRTRVTASPQLELFDDKEDPKKKYIP